MGGSTEGIVEKNPDVCRGVAFWIVWLASTKRVEPSDVGGTDGLTLAH